MSYIPTKIIIHRIHYYFTRDSAFTVDISVNRDIALPEGTQMALVSDGLLGGMAIELQIQSTDRVADGVQNTDRYADRVQNTDVLARGTFLPTTYVPGLMESLQGDLLAHVDKAVQDIDSLVASLQGQVAGNHIQSALQNVDRVSGDLTVVSSDLKKMMNNQVPRIVNKADTMVTNLNTVVADIRDADLKSTVGRVDKAVDGVNAVVADVRSKEGTLGQLIYNKALYNHIDATVISADSLLTDLKAHPKRYVHFSLFGKKEK